MFFITQNMEWKEWIGKRIFIKLNDGTVFTHSKVLAYEEPYISITDLYGLPVIINVNSIQRIKEEEDGNRY